MRVPEGWNTYKISEILVRVTDPIFPEPEEYYSEIGIRSHGKGLFHKEPVTGKSLGNKRVFRVYPDCFIVNIVFAWEQAIAKTTISEAGMIASHRFPMFQPKDNLCDVDYLTYFFKTPKGKLLLGLASPGGAGRNKTLGQNEFARLKITIPPIEEQQKIVKILSTWDKAIEKLEALIAEKQKRKKAIMQNILTGDQRFPEFTGDWVEISLKKILDVRKERSVPTENKPLYSLTIENGVTAKTERYNRDFLVRDTENKEYKQVYPNDIVYNPSNLRWGAISISKLHNIVLVSPIYEVLYIKDTEKYCPSFIYHLLMSPRQIAKFSCMAEGTLIERMAVKVKPFLATRIFIPKSIDEQRIIASVLSTADNEIEGHQKQLIALKEQKRGLMQQLLTGKKRVKINKPVQLVEMAEA